MLVIGDPSPCLDLLFYNDPFGSLQIRSDPFKGNDGDVSQRFQWVDDGQCSVSNIMF